MASELVKNKGYNPLSAIETAVAKDFHMSFAGGEFLEDFRSTAGELLRKFARKRSDDFGRIEEVEYRLEFPIQNSTISGRVDVILKDGNDLEVREYKTSEEAKTFEESSIQTRLYTLGLRSLGRQVSSGSIAYLEKADVKYVNVGEEKITTAKTLAEQTVNSIIEGDFTPRCGEHCKKCDQQAYCRWGCE